MKQHIHNRIISIISLTLLFTAQTSFAGPFTDAFKAMWRTLGQIQTELSGVGDDSDTEENLSHSGGGPSSKISEEKQEEDKIRAEIRSQQTWREGWKVGAAAATIVVYPCAAAAAWHARSHLPEIPAPIATGLSTGGALAGLSSLKDVAAPLMRNVEFILTKLKLKSKSEADEMQDRFYELEEDFHVRKKYLSQEQQRIIVKELKTIQAQIDLYSGEAYRKQVIDTAAGKIRTLFQLPYKPVAIENESAVRNHLAEELATYSSEIQQRGQIVLTRLIAGGSVSNAERNTKATYYLNGEPGTGKTTFVKNLAELAGLPFCEIKLAALEPSEFFGKRDASGLTISRLADCLTRTNSSGRAGTNVVILLDEVHDILSSNAGPERRQRWFQILKMITEGSVKKVRDEALGVDIDISKVTFFLAGNELLEDRLFRALNDRMERMEFPALTYEQKSVVGRKYFQEQCKTYELRPTQDDFDAVEQIIQRDRAPGMRSIQHSIEDYVLERKTPSFSNDWNLDVDQSVLDDV